MASNLDFNNLETIGLFNPYTIKVHAQTNWSLHEPLLAFLLMATQSILAHNLKLQQNLATLDVV